MNVYQIFRKNIVELLDLKLFPGSQHDRKVILELKLKSPNHTWSGLFWHLCIENQALIDKLKKWIWRETDYFLMQINLSKFLMTKFPLEFREYSWTTSDVSPVIFSVRF